MDPYIDAVLSEGARTVQIRESGETTDLTTVRASLRRLGLKAISGDVRAIKLYTEMNQDASEKHREESIKLYLTVKEYKEKWTPVFAAAKRQGLPPPSQLPHPDHLKFCYETGLPNVTGPQDVKEKEFWDWLKAVLQSGAEYLVQEEERCSETGSLSDKLKLLRKSQRKLLKLVPSDWDWTESI